MRKPIVPLIWLLMAASCGARNPSKEKPMTEKNPSGRHMSPGLQNNGFVIEPSAAEDMYDIYAAISDPEVLSTDGPTFVSADLYLHSLHRLVDYTTRLAEVDILLPRVRGLSMGMLDKCLEGYASSHRENKGAWALGAAYFAVGVALLGDSLPLLPDDVDGLVQKELELIKSHGGVATSPIFGDEQDYTQFIPRGHYTVNDDLERYFLGMMWFGRAGFSMKKPSQMRAALLGARALASDPDLSGAWREADGILSFISGPSDDWTPLELARLLGDRDPRSMTDEDLKALADSASRVKAPGILSGISVSLPGKPAEIPLTCRFFGQRGVPDAFMLGQLIYDRVQNYTGKDEPWTMAKTQQGPQRCFARGLDVMAALGDDLALGILEEEGDADYENYGDQMNKMREWWRERSRATPDNTYDRWLAMIGNYLERGEAPEGIRPEAWAYKRLLCSLGSWAQLKHDFILYAKQPYAAKAGAAAPGPPPPTKEKIKKAYLEDAPGLYRAGAELCRDMANHLKKVPAIQERCEGFAAFSDSLARILVKQKQGLSEKEHLWLWDAPGQLRWLSEYPWEIMERISDPEESFPMVADIMTDPNTGQCVEVGVGEPAWIKVRVKTGGETFIAEGAVFTYYEFKQPISRRLNDDDWANWSGGRPGKPGWVQAVGDY